MYLDFLNYQKFYNSSIGKLLAHHIELNLKKYCYLYDNQNIGCFGYSLPYLSFKKLQFIVIILLFKENGNIK